MKKKFFISDASDSEKNGTNVAAPRMDRFQRIEQLNAMLDLGWVIKGFESGGSASYFLLEKQG